MARYNHRILASSNLKDIKFYCSLHKIDYLTTMDFLCQALRTGLFTEARFDAFIDAVLVAGSKLPARCMKDHTCRLIRL